MTSDHLIDADYLGRHRLIAGNLDSSVAICALWKDLTRVKFSRADLECISLVGNLYTARGISRLLRGLWRLPSIRHLVIWGPDTQHTGRSLLALWQDSFDENFRIVGTDVHLDPALPAEAIDHLRQHVALHDWRETRSLPSLIERIGSLDPLPPHAKPQTFPESEPQPPQTLPSAGSGWQVSAPQVAVAWPRLLGLVMRFGIIKHSQYNIAQRELLNLLTVVTDEDHNQLYVPEYLPFNRASLNEYLPRILEDFPADDLSYTYGNRLHSYFGRNQVDLMIRHLRKAPYTRRAIATLWDPKSDPERDTPPCLTQVVLNVVDGRLHLTYTARSQDMFAAWPQNTLGMRLLQAQAASALGVEVGPITSHTVSAHLYEHDWEHAQRVIDHRQASNYGIEFDPQGNFAIRLERGQIVVELLDPAGQTVLWQTHGTSSMEIGKEIAALRLASLPAHYVYLGRELQRAEECLRRGETYDQGMA